MNTDWTQECWCQEEVRPQQVNIHWLWFPPPMVPCSRSEKIRDGSNLQEPRVIPALTCWPHPCLVYKAGGVFNRNKVYTPDSKARESCCLSVSCLGFTGLFSYSGMLEQWSVLSLSLERFEVSLCGGVQFIRKRKKRQPPSLSNTVWKCSTSHSDISFLRP